MNPRQPVFFLAGWNGRVGVVERVGESVHPASTTLPVQYTHTPQI